MSDSLFEKTAISDYIYKCELKYVKLFQQFTINSTLLLDLYFSSGKKLIPTHLIF